MFRLDFVNHVVWTVQGVTQGILVGGIVQSLNHDWKSGKEKWTFKQTETQSCICLKPPCS